MMHKDEVLNNSILVIAHPDDEILWFSSILNDVGKIVICFQDVPDHPEWSSGRAKSLAEHPLRNISSLGITESHAFNGANWQSPVITPYGLGITKEGRSAEEYINNFDLLKQKLGEILPKFSNVFTHNPWGEYGHEEHVQVYRVVKELQQEFRFNILFSNYCSNKSHQLMQKYIDGFGSDYLTLKTNIPLAHEIRDIYMMNECMTWYHDYVWFKEECFMKDTYTTSDAARSGHIFPLNYIKLRGKRPKRPPKSQWGLFSKFKDII